MKPRTTIDAYQFGGIVVIVTGLGYLILVIVFGLAHWVWVHWAG